MYNNYHKNGTNSATSVIRNISIAENSSRIRTFGVSQEIKTYLSASAASKIAGDGFASAIPIPTNAIAISVVVYVVAVGTKRKATPTIADPIIAWS
jgi:hypothetical protein